MLGCMSKRHPLKQAIERAAKYPFERFLIEDILERWGKLNFFRHFQTERVKREMEEVKVKARMYVVD